MMKAYAAAVLVFLPFAVRADAHECATQPPPAGVAERCRSLTFLLPSPPRSHESIRTSLDVRVREWIESCFPGRPPDMADEGKGSLEDVFNQVKDAPSHQGSVRILADYTPRTYSEGGRTCYGVDAASFRVTGIQPLITDEELKIAPDPTSERIKEAAAAARRALGGSSVRVTAELRRFMRVLDQMARAGTDFDDTWYNVQPFASGDSMNAGACYKDFRAGQGQVCRPAADAATACERHLAAELIQSYYRDKVSPQRFAEILEIKAGDIQRSVDHLALIQAQDSRGAVPCPSVETFFMPKIAKLAHQYNSVYGAGQY